MTQREQIQTELDFTNPKTASELHSATGILKPNIRRILGTETKRGTFKRIAKGVYVLNEDNKDKAFIYTADARYKLPELAEQGFRADMIFLDIPYNTPAIKGGNRGIKYDTIEPHDFYNIARSLKMICRNEDTPLIYMYSQAKSGLKKMNQYTEALYLNGFQVIAQGNYYKYQQDGQTRCRNMRGAIIEPEGILILNQSGNSIPELTELEFHLIRPKGYQFEKPAPLLNSLIRQTTQENDMVLDSFAGSGITIKEALSLNRRAMAIEISDEAVKNYIIPKLTNQYSFIY